MEIHHRPRNRRDRAAMPFRSSLHARVMLVGTAVAAGGRRRHPAAGVDARPRWRPLGEEDLDRRALIWVTARTAGFNTIDIATLGNPTPMLLMLLMFVGAGRARWRAVLS
ncbi:MAG: hypothetical protein U0802_08355 [Candidatus Binatia bacterium]